MCNVKVLTRDGVCPPEVAVMFHRVACMAAIVLAGSALSCGGGKQRARGESADVDALRSLPYVGFTSKKVGAEGSGVVFHDTKLAHPGYNLYTSWRLCRADLIDMDGRVLRSWKEPDCHQWGHVELTPEGDLLITGSGADEETDTRDDILKKTYLMKMTWDGAVAWKVSLPANHDVELTPRRQILTLSQSAWRRIPEINPDVDVNDHSLVVLSEDGTVIESASLYDLLSTSPEVFSFQKVAVNKKFGGAQVPLEHPNSIEWMHYPHLVGKHPIYALNNVLVSLRNQDSIFVIDWDAKKLIWAWGKGEVSGQHDAQVLENGHILLFDNGLVRKASRAVELDPITRQIVWQYKAPDPGSFFSPARGSVQRLANGNTLISNSDSGEAFEVTREGKVVWRFLSPHLNERGERATIVRMIRFDKPLIERYLTRSSGADKPATAPATSARSKDAKEPAGDSR